MKYVKTVIEMEKMSQRPQDYKKLQYPCFIEYRPQDGTYYVMDDPTEVAWELSDKKQRMAELKKQMAELAAEIKELEIEMGEG